MSTEDATALGAWATVAYTVLTAVIAWFAFKAYMAQNKQLSLLLEDRENAALAKSPHFVPRDSPENARPKKWANVVKANGFVDAFDAEKDECVLYLTNIAIAIQVWRVEVRPVGHPNEESFEIYPAFSSNAEVIPQFFTLQYPTKWGVKGQVVRLKVMFLTKNGVEQVHVYETRIQERHFRRIRPSSFDWDDPKHRIEE